MEESQYKFVHRVFESIIVENSFGDHFFLQILSPLSKKTGQPVAQGM